MALRSKTVIVFSVCVDTEDDYNGNMRTVRYTSEVMAKQIAGENTCWGRPATVSREEVPRKLAQRWGLV